MINKLKELHEQGADVTGTGTNGVIKTVGFAVGCLAGYGLSQKFGIDNGSLTVLGGLTGATISSVAHRISGGIKKEKSINA